jgi:hypothetical protein
VSVLDNLIEHKIATKTVEIVCECGRVFRGPSAYVVHADYEAHRRRVLENKEH